jgi:crotonobetainyl-CoA:carnitine CoA-transferase CaiB-like acyl-CoA transferase
MRSISACTRNFTTAELCARLLAEDVPHGPVRRREEVVCDGQFAHACVRAYGDDGHRTRMAIAPARGGKLEARPPTAAPAVGQHSAEILRELGLAEARINDLLEGGAVLQASH